MKQLVSHERLRQAAPDAAEKLLNKMKIRLRVEELANILKCTYVPKDGSLGSNSKIAFEWKVRGQGKAQTEHKARNVLHVNHLPTPKVIELPLIIACLPKSIEKHLLLPGMKECAEVRVLWIGIPKHRPTYETCTVEVHKRSSPSSRPQSI